MSVLWLLYIGHLSWSRSVSVSVLCTGDNMVEVNAIGLATQGQKVMLVFTIYNKVAHPLFKNFKVTTLCCKKDYYWHGIKIYTNRLQVTWTVCTETLDLKGIEMAVNDCWTLHWWLPLIGNGKSPCWQILPKSLCDMVEWSWNSC